MWKKRQGRHALPEMSGQVYAIGAWYLLPCSALAVPRRGFGQNSILFKISVLNFSDLWGHFLFISKYSSDRALPRKILMSCMKTSQEKWAWQFLCHLFISLILMFWRFFPFGDTQKKFWDGFSLFLQSRR